MAATVSFPAAAAAAPVLVMGPHGRVHRADDPYLTGATPTPSPAVVQTRRPAPRAVVAKAPAKKKRKPAPTVSSELSRLDRTGQIDASDYNGYRASWAAAGAAAKHLRGTRASQLKAVMANLQAMAAAHTFTPSRLPALFLTLDRNRQWWTSGPMLTPGQEIEFTGSNLVWEYYAGQGLELQVLATFGRADGMYTAGRSSYPQMRALLDEMIPLAVDRAGGIAWEYYFRWEGGAPPWTSAMSQGTGLEALTRAAKAFGPAAGPTGSPDTYLQIAQEALPIFTVAPPTGVRVPTPVGARYLQYTFSPRTDIINAFLQSLIGLYDYARLSGNAEGEQLFSAGNAQAQAELPRFDTGAWSLYQPGLEDDLSYHELVTGFLDQLCSRTKAPVYCTTAQHFHAYMKTPPVVRQLTTQAVAKRRFTLRFSLSKYSHVGIVVSRGQQTVFQTSASFPYGVDRFAVPALKAGSYQVVLAATDLPGNFARIVGNLQVSPPRRST
jgi:D-glucuronyl C5-epimerase C-terminus